MKFSPTCVEYGQLTWVGKNWDPRLDGTSFFREGVFIENKSSLLTKFNVWIKILSPELSRWDLRAESGYGGYDTLLACSLQTSDFEVILKDIDKSLEELSPSIFNR